MIRRAVVTLAFLSACSSDGTSVERARLASLSFEVPAGWHRIDGQRPGLVTAEWRPDDNERKESILVMRSEVFAVAAAPNIDAIEKLLVTSHSTTKGTSGPTRLVTASGIEAVRIEFDFTPPNSKQVYHRVHAVLRDGASLVHVLYTARKPDPELENLRFLVDSLRREEG